MPWRGRWIQTWKTSTRNLLQRMKLSGWRTTIRVLSRHCTCVALIIVHCDNWCWLCKRQRWCCCEAEIFDIWTFMEHSFIPHCMRLHRCCNVTLHLFWPNCAFAEEQLCISIYSVVQKTRPPLKFLQMLTDFYSICTRCTELICNVTVIELPTSHMYCSYTTLGNKSSA